MSERSLIANKLILLKTLLITIVLDLHIITAVADPGGTPKGPDSFVLTYKYFET